MRRPSSVTLSRSIPASIVSIQTVPQRPPAYVSPRTEPANGTALDVELDRVRTLATVMDRYFVDPILGLIIPGGGDVLGSLLGLYTVMIAARRKVSPVVIARMLMNLAGDAILGFIPFAGDLFDFGFKANRRNVELLATRVGHGGRATPRDWLILVGAALAFLAVIALVIYGIVALVRAIA
jgi:Domain of unknown function (DUF4112)